MSYVADDEDKFNNPLLHTLAVFVMTLIILYPIGVLINTSFNILEWTEEFRKLSTIILTVSITLAYFGFI